MKSVWKGILSLINWTLIKLGFKMSRQTEYVALQEQGRQHLDEWCQYIQSECGSDKPEDWFQVKSFGHFNLQDDYLEFSYLSLRYRLQLRISPLTGEGFIELWEMHSNKSTDEGGKIWEPKEHIENMDVMYMIGIPLQFRTPKEGRKIGGLAIPLLKIDNLHQTYCVEFDKETELRERGQS